MNILDTPGVQQLMRSHQPAFVFHLAAMLSSHAERDPELASLSADPAEAMAQLEAGHQQVRD